MKNLLTDRVSSKSVIRDNGIGTLGPVSDLERHLPSDWWRSLFNSLYLKTDGDVVENDENTRREVDHLINLVPFEKDDDICDLCCGQGRHLLEMARRGFQSLYGIDRSRYLIRVARKRATKEELNVAFHEGDARKFRRYDHLFDKVMLLGNSFGYFEQREDDRAVLRNVARMLAPEGYLILDVVDGSWMKDHYEKRSWEWIDGLHFVCRERALSQDGTRIISREVITHSEKGVIADQFYAERLYTRQELADLLESLGFRSVKTHDPLSALSTRDQDLGMMARRMIFTATAPIVPMKAKTMSSAGKKITVLLGDPRLPDPVKRNSHFNQEDKETVDRMKQALSEIPGYEFKFVNQHKKMSNT